MQIVIWASYLYARSGLGGSIVNDRISVLPVMMVR